MDLAERMMKDHFSMNVNLHNMIIVSVCYHSRLKSFFFLFCINYNYCPFATLKVLDKHLFEDKDIWNVDETSTVTVQVFSSV